MTWTYTPSTIATTPRDQVRWLVGDTQSGDQQVQDEEIAFALLTRPCATGVPYGAAADVCKALAAKLSRKVDITTGQLTTHYAQQSRNYAARAVELDAMAQGRGAVIPFEGGISRQDKDQTLRDVDRVAPQYSIGQDDNFLPVSPAGKRAPNDGGII